MSVASGYSASRATDKASDKVAETAEKSNALTLKMYTQSRKDAMPWLTAGKAALKTLETEIAKGPGDFTKSEYFQQGLSQANKATDRYLASRGMYASGKAGKDLQRNAIVLNQMNRGSWLDEWKASKLSPLQSVAGVGQSTATSTGASALKTAALMGRTSTSASNTIAANYINKANAQTAASQSTVNALASYYGSKSKPTSTTSTTSSSSGTWV